MQKPKRKLDLNRETIRQLDENQLAEVNGGTWTLSVATGISIAVYTYTRKL